MKRLFLLLTMIVLISTMALVACGEEATEPEPTPAPEPTPEPAEVIELKFTSWVPPKSLAGVMMDTWIERIHDQIGDRVNITAYHGGTLGSSEDHYDMIINRIADLGQGGGGPTMWRSLVSNLPFIYDSAEQAGWVHWQLMEKYTMDTEGKDVKYLFLMPVAPDNLLNNGKQVRTLEDLKNMKLATGSDTGLETMKALGAASTFIPAPDMYSALERGLVDGLASNWEKAFIFKEHEVTKYRTGGCNMWVNVMAVYMNWDAWNELPADIQQVFDATGGFDYSVENGANFDGTDLHFLDIIKEYDAGVGNPEPYNITPEERERWKEATQSVRDDWLSDMENEGLPGQEIMDFVLAKVKEYNESR